MEAVQKFEEQLIDFYKQFPHLPKDVTKAIADYAWVIALVGVVLTVLVTLPLVFLLLGTIGLLSVVAGPFGAAIGGALTVAVVISLVFSIITLYLVAIAINPLKEKKKKGWDYIYYATLVNIVAAVLTVVFSGNIGGLISSLIGALIGGYFLFETRHYFVAHAGVKSASHKIAKVVGKK